MWTRTRLDRFFCMKKCRLFRIHSRECRLNEIQSENHNEISHHHHHYSIHLCFCTPLLYSLYMNLPFNDGLYARALSIIIGDRQLHFRKMCVSRALGSAVPSPERLRLRILGGASMRLIHSQSNTLARGNHLRRRAQLSRKLASERPSWRENLQNCRPEPSSHTFGQIAAILRPVWL